MGLEKLLNKDYISKDGRDHFRAIRLREPTHPDDPFRFYVIEGCGSYSHIPLTDFIHTAYKPKDLLRHYIEKTPAAKVLFDTPETQKNPSSE